jgi:hypothetical protein
VVLALLAAPALAQAPSGAPLPPEITSGRAAAPLTPARPADTGITRVALQAPAPGYRAPRGREELPIDYKGLLEPPGADRLFRLEAEPRLKERIRQESRVPGAVERIIFPEEKVTTEAYRPRAFPPAQEVADPYYVCYGRLYFEQINSERYGWDLGPLQPLISAGMFYWDVLTLPYHMGTEPCRCYECNAGYCLPGDPVPYLIYPPQLSLTGAAAEAAAVTGVAFAFP